MEILGIEGEKIILNLKRFQGYGTWGLGRAKV